MDKLSISRMVAAHPRIQELTRKRDAMFRRMLNDYGPNFTGLHYATDDVTEETLTAEMENGKEGVNRWTQPEKNEYLTLETRINNLRETLRDALTNHYASNA